MRMKQILVIMILVAFLAIPIVTQATNPLPSSAQVSLDQATKGLDVFTKDGTKITAVAFVANAVKTLLSIVGIIMVIMIIWGGFIWMTAGGDEAKVKKGKDIIVNTTIGLIIVLSAYIITYFVTQTIVPAV